MCGIVVIIQGVQFVGEDGRPAEQVIGTDDEDLNRCTVQLNDFADVLAARGPDRQQTATIDLGGGASISCLASVLQLRGSEPSAPRHAAGDGDTLLFNGEVFGGLHVEPGTNDADAVAAALAAEGDAVAVLQRLRGPWAAVHGRADTRTLTFGRDVFGKRSLLVHWPNVQDDRVILASVAHAPPKQVDVAEHSTFWQELSPGLVSIVFEAPQPAATSKFSSRVRGQLRRHAWTDPQLQCITTYQRAAEFVPQQDAERQANGAASDSDQSMTAAATASRTADADSNAAAAPNGAATVNASEPAPALEPQAGSQTAAGPSEVLPDPQALSQAAAKLLRVLAEAVRVRCLAVDEVASDRRAAELAAACDPSSELHARFSAATCRQHSLRPSCDASGSSIASSSADVAYASADGLPHSSTAAMCTRDSSQNGAHERSCKQLPQPADARRSCGHLSPAPVLVLFSGGVDSTLLAALAHQALPQGVPIDLATVCFAGGTSPDRLAALDALEELAAWAPNREWRLIEVDATLEGVEPHQQHLLQLLAPSGTVMDLNIGTALWCAAHATGRLRYPASATWRSAAHRRATGDGQAGTAPADAAGGGMASEQQAQQAQSAAALHALPSAATAAEAGPPGAAADAEWRPAREGEPYRSCARVALLGHGADEQCGGYGRHRTTFRRAGWRGLAEELGEDTQRLWSRNLGRDDRLVADTGREARHPFLAEEVVETILVTPLPLVADLRLPPGIGDKIILREALRQLGLPRAAARVKRAIQFGSRIGKAANCRDFGSNRAANIANAGSVRLVDLLQR